MTSVKAEGQEQTQESEQEPRIFAVEKDLSGWKFSRRDLLAAVGAATAASAMAGCGAPEPTPTPNPPPTLSPVEEATARAPIQAHSDQIEALAISPDGTLLASGGWEDTIKLWSLPETALLRTLEGHKDDVNALVMTPDGTMLISASSDHDIMLWPLREGGMPRTLSGHTDRITCLALTADGSLLASGRWDDTIKLWSLPDGALLKTLEVTGVQDVAIIPDGTFLASCYAGNIRLWSLPDGALVREWQGPAYFGIQKLAVSPDGTLLVSGNSTGDIDLWSLPEGTKLKALEGHRKSMYSLAITPDGTMLASGGEEGDDYSEGYDDTIKLWSLPDGALLKTLHSYLGMVKALAVTPDGTLLASAGFHAIKLWSLSEGRLLSWLMDLDASPKEVQGSTYEVKTSTGQLVTYTLPCGSPIPAGAVCVCDCVAGSYVPCSCDHHSSHYWYPC